ncbi:MAG: DUF1028 domain-containing protein [Candidatus Dormibacteraeota bacterium]|nr:DUF1028 domain-containing protein [Candidatus Dormibacteraeota bacterium]
MTYSIVARDPATGELGVAVQSHYFQVGPTVPWARAQVGAVATQSRVEVRFGPLGLRLMAAGYPADRALASVLAADPEAEVRQVAMVDASGRAAAHTGSRCIAEAGHRVGDGYSVQANMMLRSTVWDAMAEAYEASSAALPERMLAALVAAEAQGGDIRGRQSAAILVVAGQRSEIPGQRSEDGQRSDFPGADRVVDLRVEDHPEPLEELIRLMRLKRAYQAHNLAAQAHLAGDREASEAAEAQALALGPELVEVRFWTGLRMVERGQSDRARELLEPILRDPHWRALLPRLPQSGRISVATLTAVESLVR